MSFIILQKIFQKIFYQAKIKNFFSPCFDEFTPAKILIKESIIHILLLVCGFFFF